MREARIHCENVGYVKSNVYVGRTIGVHVCLFMFNKINLINVYMYNTCSGVVGNYLLWER